MNANDYSKEIFNDHYVIEMNYAVYKFNVDILHREQTASCIPNTRKTTTKDLNDDVYIKNNNIQTYLL